jgi:carbon-monoxide dehydrogenase iron sulfur subunit
MKGMLNIEIARCTGCKTCEIECAVAHSVSRTLTGVIKGGEKVQKRIHVEKAGDLNVPVNCRHCEDAPCVAVCPTGAMNRFSQGFPVLLDEAKCIGCRACLVVCPFGAISMAVEGRVVSKCDLCVKRQAEGLQPACAAGCPTKAITFTNSDSIAAEARRKTAESYLVAVELGKAV